MSDAPPGERIRRRAVVVAVEGDRTALRWTESTCRGCVGCGGRCSLFGGHDDAVLHLPARDVDAGPGAAVDVEVDGRALRGGAARAYGLAIATLLLGVVLGHAIGREVAMANVGALLGLVAGTFLAGRLTKRLDAAPPLRVRPCPDPDPTRIKERSR